MIWQFIILCSTLFMIPGNVTGQRVLVEEPSYEEKARQRLFFLPGDRNDEKYLDETVFIPIFVRNKEHSLPYFFKGLEDLDYDKKRIYIWIVCDHSRDDSASQINAWVMAVQAQYMKVEAEIQGGPWHYPGQTSDLSWTKDRHLRMLELRQLALIKAREVWADYIFYVDTDNILMNPFTLRHLISKDKVIVAPMLYSPSSYTNFWGGMNNKGYYLRTDEYFPIRNNEINGTFAVALVHSTYLIDLRTKKSRDIQYLPLRKDYKYDFDDIIIFACHCKSVRIDMYVDNSVFYGYMPVPLDESQTLEDEFDAFLHLRMEVMTEPPVGVGIEMLKSAYVEERELVPSKLGFNEIYVINLKRRKDRRVRMKKVLKLQGIDFTIFDAVDSHNLDENYLQEMGINMLPDYVDPYSQRPLTWGEIGCFMSHFHIWNDVIEKGYDKVIVMEDDVRFQTSFVRKVTDLMERIAAAGFKWDLIYIGRKRLKNVEEYRIDEIEGLVEPGYSYWTLGYLLSKSGAEKLKDGDPLGRMVPVDEYIPIMFDKHPNDAYSDNFHKRNLIALSVDPLYVFPTHYTKDVNHFSDTETSSIWDTDSENNSDILNDGNEEDISSDIGNSEEKLTHSLTKEEL